MQNNHQLISESDEFVGTVSNANVHSMLLAGKERLQDLVRQSTVAVQEVLAEAREVIAKCEAELDVHEEFSVIIEANRVVLNAKRDVHFAKDRP